jgi:hypothetical protein
VPEQRWYLPLYLDPGEHHLGAMAPGKKRVSVVFRVTSSPTDQVVMVPALVDDPTTVSDSMTSSSTGSGTANPVRANLGLIGLGLGVVGAAVGTTFGVLAVTEDTTSAMKQDATVATIAFVAGAVLGATGGWLLWTSKTRTARAAVAPNPGGASLGLGATF